MALLTVLLQHRQKMAELNNAHNKTKLQVEQLKTKQIPLEHHPLFTTLDELEYFFMWTFSLQDPGRTMIIRELCVNKLRVWRNVILQHVHESQICYSNCQSVNRNTCNVTENNFRKMLLEGLDEYTSLWDVVYKQDIFCKHQYDEASIATMKTFLPIFQEWHLSREEMVRLAAHDIPNSGMNTSCYHDWWDMLTVYMYAFTQMKYDSLNAMKSLNGEITGKQFLGTTVGDIR